MTLVEVFADVCCPFTYVGLRRLVQRRDEVGADVQLVVRAWPLELVNGVPLDPEQVAEEIDELRTEVAPDLFAGFDPSRFPTTSLPALELAAASYRHDLASGERVSLMLREALFERGRNIAHPDELATVAEAIRLTGPISATDQVHADWHEGQRRGVIGSPHFFVGDSDFFCPGLHIERIDGRLRITRDLARFDEFIERCTGS
jgi:2-hydroxychromene-2-carboxylate isomerase